MKVESKDENDVFLKETAVLHDLRALEEIEKNPRISQRELSSRLGVALGITNSLLKTLARKGLIKIRGKNNRSLSYHLTHTGVLAKSALAMKWTLNTIDFYRQTRFDVAEKMAKMAAKGARSIIIYGLAELSEIAMIVASEVGLEVVGVVDGEAATGHRVMGCPVISANSLGELTFDAIVICVPGDEVIEEIGRYVDADTQLMRLL